MLGETGRKILDDTIFFNFTNTKIITHKVRMQKYTQEQPTLEEMTAMLTKSWG